MDEITVMLVDDEEEFVTTLAERLELRDMEVRVALSGEEAVHLLVEFVPQVMVLDLKMPGMDGLEVLRVVHSQHPEVKAIMLTGHGSEKDREEAMRIGACDYLHKPVDITELTERIKKAVAG